MSPPTRLLHRIVAAHPVAFTLAACLCMVATGVGAASVGVHAGRRHPPGAAVAGRDGTGRDGASPVTGLHPAPSRTPGASPSTGGTTTAPTPGSHSTRTGAAPGGAARCALSVKLVPGCGVLLGVAPGAYTDLPASRALADFEEKTGRPSDILHSYHRGDDLFPTPDEMAALREDGHQRLLFANWKVAWGTTWARVAAGGEDARIDRLAGYLRQHFTQPFYLAIHHEPENDVNPTPGSGMTASDYAAMYAHTVRRLRADGVGNAVFVMVYMSYEPWCVQPWFGQLWPGDDVVDWVGFDPYLFARPGGYGYGDFAYLVNRTSDPARWPGFYTWATHVHGNKPLMVAEWGVFENPADPSKKAWIYSTVAAQLGRYPAVKALVYFDSPAAPKGDTRPDSSSPALEQYRRLAESALFTVRIG